MSSPATARNQPTLLEVVADLRSRFGLQRVVWVGDRGMVTLGNLEQLRQAGQGYLMGLQRRNRQDIADYIEEALAKDGWQECEVGITASEKAQPPRTRVREVAGKRQGVRVFVVDSEERKQYEQARREQARERVREKLERLQQRVERGALKQPEKIGAAAAAIVGRHHGHRYFQWELRQGQFHYREHEVNFAGEKLLEGKYVIQTEETNLTPLEAVAAYKELNEVERGFAQLKGLLEVRPVYHRRDERVRAHVFVAALALLLDRALEKKRRAADCPRRRPGGPWRRCGWWSWSWASGANAASPAAAARRRKCCACWDCRSNLTPRRRPPARKPSCSDQSQKPPLRFQSVSRPERKHALAQDVLARIFNLVFDIPTFQRP